MQNQLEEWMNVAIGVDLTLAQRPKLDYAKLVEAQVTDGRGYINSGKSRPITSQRYLGVQIALADMEGANPSVTSHVNASSLKDYRLLGALGRRHEVAGIPIEYHDGEAVWRTAQGLVLNRDVRNIASMSVQELQSCLVLARMRRIELNEFERKYKNKNLERIIPIEYKNLERIIPFTEFRSKEYHEDTFFRKFGNQSEEK